MSDEPLAVGIQVRLPETHQRGTVREIDHGLLVARVELHKGGELWARWDQLEIVTPWRQTRTEHRSIA